MNTSRLARNTRILIVDDNRAIHEDFRKILGQRQSDSFQFDEETATLFGLESSTEATEVPRFHLDSAYQGQEGLSLVAQARSAGQPYALALVDMRMPPGWDGVETTARLWEADPDLQVVICTAYSDCSWDEMLRKLGHSDRLVILKKPFDNIEVFQLANSLCWKWQLLQESKGKLTNLEETVMARTVQIVQEQEKFKAIFENSPEGIFQTTLEGRYVAANPALAAMYGYASPQELMEQLTDVPKQLYVESTRRTEFQTLLERENIVRDFESEIQCKDGSRKWIKETACRVTRPDGSLSHYQGFVVDVTAQRKAQSERTMMELQLRQAQKLESVGQLAAGIAHEINTPIQYIGDNIRFIEEAFANVSELLGEYRKLAAAVEARTVTPEAVAEIEACSEKVDIHYLSEEIPLAVKQSLDGVKRVTHIVKAMKEFAHPGTKNKVEVDLNHLIETTVTVAHSEWKYVADLVTKFDSDLTKVLCLPSEFNQVILNLIVNAAHAIGDVVKNQAGTKGTITIGTRLNGSWVEIRISDTGIGIPESIRHRVFDPFFTTKEVGKGTGQGLAIARSVVVDKHGGELNFESEVGKGTTFLIRLPVGIAPTAGVEFRNGGSEQAVLKNEQKRAINLLRDDVSFQVPNRDLFPPVLPSVRPQ